MKIAFLHARQDPKYALLMMAAVCQQMPNVDILHLTDDETDPLVGSITVRRSWKHDNPMIFKMEHLAELDGDVIVLDTDVIVQRNLADVFRFDFDMALTWRSEKIVDGDGTDVTKLMPYNCGVMFQRSKFFWKEALRFLSDKDVGWYADQIAVAKLAPHFNVMKLHCDNFNYTPKSESDDISKKYAVHYKGTSRHLMDKRFGL